MVDSEIYISLFYSSGYEYISAPTVPFELLSNSLAPITLQPYIFNSIGYKAFIYDIICYR